MTGSLRLRSTLPSLALGILAFAAGCKRGPVTYSVTVDTFWIPRSAQVHVTYRGREVPLSPANDGQELAGTFTASGEEWVSEDPTQLVLAIETPCGPLTFRYREESERAQARDLIRPHEKDFGPSSAPVMLPFLSQTGPDTLLVHVDRREAESLEVALGKQALPAGKGLPLRPYSTRRADQVGDVYEVAVPKCEEGKTVSVGGQPVGAMTLEGANTHVVIDAKGGHCYKRTESSYSSLPVAGVLPFQRPKSTFVKGARAFAFGDGPPKKDTDVVLATCPSMMSGRVSCTEVWPVSCDEAL